MNGNPPRRFCASCGAPRSEGARFCEACGQSFEATPLQSSAVPPQPAAPWTQPAMPFPQPASQPSSWPPPAPQAAPAQAVDPRGWHVVVGDELPVFQPLPAPPAKAASLKARPSKARSEPTPQPSVRGAVIMQAILTFIDYAATSSQNPAAVSAAEMRGGIAVISLVLGLIAGKKRGAFSVLTILSSLALAVTQIMVLVPSLERGMNTPGAWAQVAPAIIPQALALLASLRTAWRARKRK